VDSDIIDQLLIRYSALVTYWEFSMILIFLKNQSGYGTLGPKGQ